MLKHLDAYPNYKKFSKAALPVGRGGRKIDVRAYEVFGTTV
jgi:hypothetical protein